MPRPLWMAERRLRAVCLFVAGWMAVGVTVPLAAQKIGPVSNSDAAPSLATAERLYYMGDYAAAAEMALALRTANPQNLAAYELRTSALHFQVKRLLGDAKDRGKALKACAPCPALLAAFAEETTRGLAVARAKLVQDPQNLETTFLLGKIDLNHVWLYLGTLGRKTAFNEYREARRLMEAVLKREPGHVRARVAHAWIEYIVDTRVPFLFQWALGGGDKKKALAEMRKAAEAEAPFIVQTEARFALWEMLNRDKRVAEALVPARALLADFPENRELLAFIDKHGRP
ncbi:MAG: hypothetical protein ABL971_05035 [Vicinamibacterales bacterium]